MREGGFGGGKTITGLHFERNVDFLTRINEIPGYSIKESPTIGKDILFNSKVVATCFKKHQFYEYLKTKGVNWKKIISKKLLPDDAILVVNRKTLFIIEVKFQQVEGSVDEKLQTCDFKRKQYIKLVTPLELFVEYVYVLNDWFRHPKYKDVLDYIISVNCRYVFEEIPLQWLGFPEPLKPKDISIE